MSSFRPIYIFIYLIILLVALRTDADNKELKELEKFFMVDDALLQNETQEPQSEIDEGSEGAQPSVNGNQQIPQARFEEADLNVTHTPQVPTVPEPSPEFELVHRILERVPLIDGHNDLPHTLRKLFDGQIISVNLTDVRGLEPWESTPSSHTDIRRLREGKVGAQFWVAYTKCKSQHLDSTQKAFEQIDIIYRIIQQYPETFELVTSAQEIEDAFSRGKIASLIGVEGGHAMGNSLGILRMFYRLGVRYMTLTHACPTPWADNSQLDNPGQQAIAGGLTGFGEVVIQEMNRLGMMVDISHVSEATMSNVLNVSLAPVIFSHSGAFAVCNNTRNAPDHILRKLKVNGGVIMVVFYNDFVNCGPEADIMDVIRHIQHIREVAGVDHIGIGGDYNGVERMPVGLEDVSTYPNLFVELLKLGWTENELEKLAGKNLLRVMRRVEQIRDELSYLEPIEDIIPGEELPYELRQCTSSYD